MRQFSAEYLDVTRKGMWADSRAALSSLALESADCVLDVGAGTGALTRVLREETDGSVIALDADGELLSSIHAPRVRGDATRLPLAADSVDLVVCQALLVNLPDPLAAVQEFARVARERVAAIEPDNSAVSIESTVEAEAPLARRARRLYLDGVSTDASMGAARTLFDEAGLGGISVDRYDHERVIEPPYDEYALTAAKRKASGVGLARDRETILAGETSPEEFDALKQEWRTMGRSVVDQMQTADYQQRERVPFYVTVGRV